jgi:hypothetical protein
MYKILKVAALICLIAITLGLAQRAKTGIGGKVYDAYGQLAGSNLDSIVVFTAR